MIITKYLCEKCDQEYYFTYTETEVEGEKINKITSGLCDYCTIRARDEEQTSNTKKKHWWQ